MQGAEPGFQKIPGETASTGNPAQESQITSAAEKRHAVPRSKGFPMERVFDSRVGCMTKLLSER